MTKHAEKTKEAETGRREEALITELVSAFRYADPDALVGLYGNGRAQLDGTFDMRRVIGRFLARAREKHLL